MLLLKWAKQLVVYLVCIFQLNYSICYAIDPKYNQAINTTKEAILIKTGAIDLKNQASDKVKREVQAYLIKNNLKFLYIVGIAAYPIIFDKEIRIKSGPWELRCGSIKTTNLGLYYKINFGR